MRGGGGEAQDPETPVEEDLAKVGRVCEMEVRAKSAGRISVEEEEMDELDTHDETTSRVQQCRACSSAQEGRLACGSTVAGVGGGTRGAFSVGSDTTGTRGWDMRHTLTFCRSLTASIANPIMNKIRPAISLPVPKLGKLPAFDTAGELRMTAKAETGIGRPRSAQPFLSPPSASVMTHQ